MLQKTRYIVVLTFPKKIDTKLQLLREKYDTLNSLKIVPHLTIKRPFFVKTEIEHIENKLEKATKKVHGFYIKLNGVGKFYSPKRVFYVNVIRSKALDSLYKIVNRSLDGVTENSDFISYNFTPHITLGSDLTKERFKKIQEELFDFYPNDSIFIDSYKIFLFGKNNRWKQKKEFILT